jgi:predicted dehydrogenase
MTGVPPATLRFGVLGAARINSSALIAPAGRIEGIEIAAIAARDPHRARSFAAEHRIAQVHADYESLLADDRIDAVYVPLPAALHGRWTLAAIRAGKHVLCEKPFTANAPEAEQVAAAAASTDTVVMEAYHSFHHPLRRRLQEIVGGGMLGRIHSAKASFCVPIPPGRDIRWDLDLGGGGLLDVGYYPLRMLRDLLGSDPSVDAVETRSRGGIDRVMRAILRFEGNVRAEVVSSIWSRRLFASVLAVHGSEGRLRVSSPYHPQMGSVVRVDRGGIRTREGTTRRATYDYQLEAFRDAVRGHAPVLTGAPEAVAQMRVIDELYTAAGLEPRRPLQA